MSKMQQLVYVFFVSTALFFLVRYLFWWFQPEHIPHNLRHNFSSLIASGFNILIFTLLSFVVFIGYAMRLASWFALWWMSKPKYVPPKKGLRVAFLTCFVPGKEPYDMLLGTLAAMVEVRYPHDTWVLDEGNDARVKEMCRILGVKHFTRAGVAKYNQKEGIFRAKTKAGNHNAWRDRHEDDYDIVAQIDMDHVPNPDYFEKTLGYFKDPKVALVGMPQVYKNSDNWVARGASEQAHFFHGPMQLGFYGCDMPFLIGTSHMYRTTAMSEIGGYAPTIVEDHLTGMRLYARGWKGVFVPEMLATGDGPINWVDYFNQQMRWSYGLFEILFKHTPRLIWRLAWRQKINYFLSQLYYFTGIAMVGGVVLTVLYLTLGVRATSMDIFEWVAMALPAYLSGIFIDLYAHRFYLDPKREPVFGWYGMFLNLGANLIYALAFFKFLTGQKLRYMVTQKGSTARTQVVPIKTFSLHIAVVVLTGISLIVAAAYHHNAIQMKFWGVFNVTTLLFVSASIWFDKLRSWSRHHRFMLSTLRVGLRYAMVSICILAIAVSYLQKSEIVKAFSQTQEYYFPNVPVAQDELLSGVVQEVAGGSLMGVSLYEHSDIASVREAEEDLGTHFALVGYYQAWGGLHSSFNKKWNQDIIRAGGIPFITWEPWVPHEGFARTFEQVDQEQYRLKHIIDGTYDSYIIQYAQDVKSFKKPVMIRFAHEMNGGWYPWGSVFNTPQEYIAAWRHVHDIFETVGASNVTWVWSPNELYHEEKVPFSDEIDVFYPGDEYVDWVGFSAFNWAGFYKQNKFRKPDELFSATTSELKKFNKPILIAETASAEVKGTPYAKAYWIKEFSSYLKTHPEIKGFVWFQTEDGEIDWRINSSLSSLVAFEEAFKDSYFITSY